MANTHIDGAQGHTYKNIITDQVDEYAVRKRRPANLVKCIL